MPAFTNTTGRVTFGIRRLLNKPEALLSVFFLVVLGFLIITPLVEIIRESMTVQSYDRAYLPDAKPGEFTLLHYERIFAGPMSPALFIRPLLNSLAVGFGVTVLALALGTLLAWVLVRTDLPLRGTFGALAVVPYMFPSWILALAWLAMFKNDRIGGTQGLIAFLFGVEMPNWLAFGYLPIVLCLTLHYYAYTYLLMSGAMQTMDSELEEAGAIYGLRRWQRLWRITLPLLLPAVGSAVVLTFIRVLGTFGTPALLGLPVRFTTFATQIYVSLKARNAGDAYVLALVLVVLAICFIWTNSRIVGIRKSYVTVTGKGFRRRPIRLGSWRWPLTAIVGLFITTAVFLPLLILLWESCLLVDGDYSFSNFTTHFWLGEANFDIVRGEPGILHNPGILTALWNSCKLGVLAAICNAILGLLVGYAVVRARGTLVSRWLEGIAFAPYIFPAIALGAIYIGMFARPWGPIPALYGTFSILVLIMVVKNLPFTSRTGVAAMLQIDKSLEEAARVHGIGWARRMAIIILPMAANGLIAGMLLTFITVMRELSLIILLISPSNMVLPALIYSYNEQNLPQHSAAATLMLVGIIAGVNVLVRVVAGRTGGGLRMS
jgi:iron(III) transport system permease protein